MQWTNNQLISSGLFTIATLLPWGMYVLGVIGVAWLMSHIYLLGTEPRGLPPCLQPDVFPDERWPFELPGTVIYGDIAPRHPDRDAMGNRAVWKDFYDNDKF
jgi:hypothetical protein